MSLLVGALRFIAIVDEARRYQGRALLGHINRAVNQWWLV
jgi:hypothetical protein